MPPTTGMFAARRYATCSRFMTPGRGVQEVMGFAAILSRANEQFEVAPGELGHLEGLTIAIVAAEHDDVAVGAAVQNTEGVRQVRDKGAVAPGVERVAVAGDEADPRDDVVARRGR